MVLAVIFFRIRCVAVACVVRAVTLAVFFVVAVTGIPGVSIAVIPVTITYTKQKHLAVFHKLLIYEIPPMLYLFKYNPYTPIL